MRERRRHLRRVAPPQPRIIGRRIEAPSFYSDTEDQRGDRQNGDLCGMQLNVSRGHRNELADDGFFNLRCEVYIVTARAEDRLSEYGTRS